MKDNLQICQMCGAEFDRGHPSYRYCSEACTSAGRHIAVDLYRFSAHGRITTAKYAAWKRAQRNRTVDGHTCIWCEQRPRAPGPRKRYCAVCAPYRWTLRKGINDVPAYTIPIETRLFMLDAAIFRKELHTWQRKRTSQEAIPLPKSEAF